MRYAFAVTACLVLLAACSEKSRIVLAPADVLHRSVVASNTLDSFSYALDAAFHTSGKGNNYAMTGSVSLTGSLLHERTIATGFATVDVLTKTASDEQGVRLEGAYSLVPRQRPAVRIDSVSTVSGAVMLEQDARSRWISLPLDDGPSPIHAAASIDQQWIALQSSAMHVVQDFGLVQIDGRDTYHYQVALNVDVLEALFGSEEGSDEGMREALRDHLHGELWIDADTFLLRKATWNIDGIQTPRGVATLFIRIALFDQNRAVATVKPPLPNEIEYPDDGIFATIFSGALLPFLSR